MLSKRNDEEIPSELHHDLNGEIDLLNEIEKIKIDDKSDRKNDSSMGDLKSTDAYPEILTKYDKNHIFILYASQSGTGKTFSESLQRFLKKFSVGSTLSDLSEFNLDDLVILSKVPNAVVIFFLSTYGDGGPPDTGFRLEEWLNSSPDVKNMNYAIFGLGDRNYDKFCYFSKTVGSSFSKLGAKSFLKRCEADASNNQESTYVSWRATFIKVLLKSFNIPAKIFDPKDILEFNMRVLSETTIPFYKGEVFKIGSFERQRKPFHAKNPFLASLKFNNEMFSGGDRSCRLISFDIGGTALRYQPGDHLGVYPCNSPANVNRLCQLLEADLDMIIDMIPTEGFGRSKPFPCPTTIRIALSYYLNITSCVSIDVLSELINYAPCETDSDLLKQLTDPNDQSFYEDWIVKDHRNIIAVLEDLPTVRPPINVLLQSLPRLTCRYYSISSSQSLYKDEVHITVIVVDWTSSSNRHQLGVASNFLKNLCPNTHENTELHRAPIFIRRAPHFYLPQKSCIPVIMIGCGTGVAPFRGFVQHRAELKPTSPSSITGNMILFYGCRYKETEYLFRREFAKYLENGVLSHIFTAFSRDTIQKHYITQEIINNATLLWTYIEKGAYIYVCGEAAIMLKSVQEAILDAIKISTNMSDEKARQYTNELTRKGRYCVDAW